MRLEIPIGKTHVKIYLTNEEKYQNVQIFEKELILKECRTGTHSDLFESTIREAKPEYITP